MNASQFALNDIAGDANPQWRVVSIDPEALFAENERQKLAFKAAMSGHWREILFGGGMGGGKSVCLLNIAKTKALMHPGCTVLIVRYKLDQLRDQLFKALLDIVPRELWDGNPRTHPKPRLKLKNGSQIIGLPGSDPNDFRGWNNVAAILVDEAHEIPPRVFTEMLGRFRVSLGSDIKPLLFLTANPAPGYLDENYARPVGDKLDPQKLFIQSLAEDNGYIDRADYKRTMRATRSQVEFERDYEGKWGAFKGLVFPQFNEASHVDDIELPDRDELVMVSGMDHAWDNPTVIAMGAMDASGHVYVYDELWMRGALPTELAREWKRKRDEWQLRGQDAMICADTSMWKPDQSTGERVAVTLSHGVKKHFGPNGDEYCMRLVPANKALDGVQTIGMLLESGMITFDRRCKQIIKAVRELRFREPTPTEDKLGLRSEKLHPRGKDAVDALRYLCNHLRPPASRPGPSAFQRWDSSDKPPPLAWVMGDDAQRQRAEAHWRHAENQGRGWDGLYPDWRR